MVAALTLSNPPGFTLALTTYADPAAMAAWLEAAGAGDQLVYATGPALGDHPVARLVRQWIDAGAVDAVPQRRAARAHCFDYAVRKRGLSSPSSSKPDHTRAQLAALMRELRRCAAKGEPCPSDGAIARKLGLRAGKPGRRRAHYLFDRLAAERRIEVASQGRNAPRIVTILQAGRARGKCTAAASGADQDRTADRRQANPACRAAEPTAQAQRSSAVANKDSTP